jgi:adenylate cyclase
VIYTFNNITINTVNYQLLKNNKIIPIEPQVFNIILYLLENKDKVVTRQELLDTIWKGKIVSDSSISNHIKSARKALDDDGVMQTVIKTTHGRGYQFVAKCQSKKELTSNPIKPKRSPSKIIYIVLGIVVLSIIIFWNNSQQTNSPLVNNQEKSIAVLAFKDLSENSDREYFSDGISEELLNVFTKIPNLRVASRTSSFSFRNKQITLENIGKDLNVDYVMEGSVRKSGEKIRTTAQLIRVADGFHVWSETYDHEIEDIFKIQDEIAMAVSDQLKVKLFNHGKNTTVIEPKAYTLYLQAVYLLKQNTEESITKSLDLISKSIALDSNYAPSWALYGRILYTVVIYTYDKKNKSALLLSKSATLKALDIDKNYAKAYAQLALVNLLEWDYESAQKNTDLALKLDKKNSIVTAISARNLQLRGQLKKNVEMLEKAVELDPLFNINYLNLGLVYLILDRLEEAHTAMKTYDIYHPNSVAQHAIMSHILLAMGNNKEAYIEAQKESNPYWRLNALSFTTYALGMSQESDDYLQQFIDKYSQGVPSHIASLYSFRGENDKAFEWLEIAYESHETGLNQSINFRTLRNLWNDPRWDIFLAKLDLPEDHWLIAKRLDG